MKRRRRRKPSRPASKTEQQAPLQPAYPEPAETPGTMEEPTAASEAQPELEATPAQAREASQQRTGKRRRRGGRGRKRQDGRAEAIPAEEAAVEPAEAAGTGAEAEAAIEPEAHPAPRPQVQAHPAHLQKRQPKGTVVLTIGLPGSGKTSWFRRRGITPLSSDLLRMMLFDDIAEQRYQDLVFSTLRYLLRARMIARMPWNYVDATNLSPRERRGWIKMAQEFGYEAQAVFFDVPVDVCMDRNQRRGRIVPEDVMQRMAQKLRPPTFEEGFSKITVVRVKKHPKAEPDNEIQREENASDTGMIDDTY